ncbi:hypothetical protein V9T40_012498 [Parthenolecanium corni]|uniref:Uncharacterized protein n=1 Tax=Parthenolecanium corni TaxID=536013 RepID=A0AAN9XZD6_9HEMI
MYHFQGGARQNHSGHVHDGSGKLFPNNDQEPMDEGRLNISNSRFRNSANIQQPLAANTANLQSFGAGRGRGFVNATTAEPLPHERRRYADRTRSAAPLVAPGTLDLSNSRFNFPLPSNSTTTNNESQPKSLPVTRNRTTGSFNKTTIK